MDIRTMKGRFSTIFCCELKAIFVIFEVRKFIFYFWIKSSKSQANYECIVLEE